MGTEAFAPHHHRNASQESYGDATGGTDPIVIKCKFQEIGNPNQHGGDTNSIEPMGTDAGFEVCLLRWGEWRSTPKLDWLNHAVAYALRRHWNGRGRRRRRTRRLRRD